MNHNMLRVRCGRVGVHVIRMSSEMFFAVPIIGRMFPFYLWGRLRLTVIIGLSLSSLQRRARMGAISRGVPLLKISTVLIEIFPLNNFRLQTKTCKTIFVSLTFAIMVHGRLTLQRLFRLKHFQCVHL